MVICEGLYFTILFIMSVRWHIYLFAKQMNELSKSSFKRPRVNRQLRSGVESKYRFAVCPLSQSLLLHQLRRFQCMLSPSKVAVSLTSNWYS